MSQGIIQHNLQQGDSQLVQAVADAKGGNRRAVLRRKAEKIHAQGNGLKVK